MIHILSHWSTFFSCTLVVSTFHHFSLHSRVEILWSGPPGSPHIVRWEPLPVVGPELLGLDFSLRSFILFPHSHYSGNSGHCVEDPMTWRTSIIVKVCCIFTALYWNSTRATNICCLPHSFLQQYQTPQSLHFLHWEGTSLGYSLWQPGIQILLPCCHFCWWNHSISVSNTEPFYCSPNFQWVFCCCSHW